MSVRNAAVFLCLQQNLRVRNSVSHPLLGSFQYTSTVQYAPLPYSTNSVIAICFMLLVNYVTLAWHVLGTCLPNAWLSLAAQGIDLTSNGQANVKQLTYAWHLLDKYMYMPSETRHLIGSIKQMPISWRGWWYTHWHDIGFLWEMNKVTAYPLLPSYECKIHYSL